MSIGTIIFGKWNNQPIEWEILKEDDFCKLIITKDRIGGPRQFNRNNDSQWKNSEIRQFLNGGFLNQAFTNEEKTKIVDDFCKLIITKDRIGGPRQFNRNNDSQWKNSEIRQFLNGEFLNQAFTNEEKTKIVNVYLEKPNATKDNIFLLDFDEAKPLIIRPALYLKK